jgi:hypothetical protein
LWYCFDAPGTNTSLPNFASLICFPIGCCIARVCCVCTRNAAPVDSCGCNCHVCVRTEGGILEHYT